MITLEKAIELAETHYKEMGNLEISQIYSTQEVWVMFASLNGRRVFGNTGISIDKNTGDLQPFDLPSKENFELLDHAQVIRDDRQKKK